MIITLLLWIYLFLVILPYGFLCMSLASRSQQEMRWGVSSFTLAFLLGIVFLTTVASAFSLVINIGWQVHGIVLAGAIACWVWLWKTNRIPGLKIQAIPTNWLQRISLLMLLVAAGITLLSATTTPENPDTGIYHAQAIHWIENYKAVPGLGNLHERFAYNSSWLVINALFSLAFLKIQSFHILPSLLFLVSIFYFFSGVFAVSGGSRKISDLSKYAFFLATLFFLQTEISSPGTDMPVTLIVWILCAEWMKKIEDRQRNPDRLIFWLVVIAIFTITIKISSAPILLLVLWFLIQKSRKKQFKSILAVAVAGIIMAAPFIGRNIVLSGHLFYPGVSWDPIHVEWQIPPQQVEQEKQIIHWFAMLPRVDREKFQSMPWQEQYKRWFYDQVPRYKAMLAALIGFPVILLLSLVFKKIRSQLAAIKNVLWLILVMYAGVAFWLISAPNFRFGYGFIIAAITLTLMTLVYAVLSTHPRLPIIAAAAALVVTLGVSGVALRGAVHPKTLLSRILLPQDYPTWPTEPCSFGNFEITCQTEWDSCWYSPFPCAMRSNPDVYMRGSDFSDGFTVSDQR